MSRIFPELKEDVFLNLFHKSARRQWTALDLDWGTELGLTPGQGEALGRVLSPVFLGEQTAMVGASAIIPRLVEAGETTAQLYLASFMMDEARHVEVLARLYERIGQHPASIRDLPEMLRYHHRLRMGDRIDWVWGILISDLVGKHFYRSFIEADSIALLGQISTRILQDESRHLAFAEHYLRRYVPTLGEGRRRALLAMRDDLYGLVGVLIDRLRAECDLLCFDSDQALKRLWSELDTTGWRIGLAGGDGPAVTGTAEASPGVAAEPPETSESSALSEDSVLESERQPEEQILRAPSPAV